MDVIYYITSFLTVLGIPAITIAVIVYLTKPKLLNNSKLVKKPVSRKKIGITGLLAVFVMFFGFGSVLAATEPASVKQERIAREAATAKAEQQKARQQKNAIEKERLRKIEAAKPVVKVEIKTAPIPFAVTERNDGSIPLGERRVASEGALGKRAITYNVTYVNGKETKRTETKNEVTKAAVDKVTLVGTYVKPVVPAPTVSAPQYVAPQSNGARTGARCNDGSLSSAIGRGACSHHGGVAQWLY